MSSMPPLARAPLHVKVLQYGAEDPSMQILHYTQSSSSETGLANPNMAVTECGIYRHGADLLKGGDHMPSIVLGRAVGRQLEAAVKHGSAQAVKAHGVHVVRAGVRQAGAAGDALDVHVPPPVQRLLQPLDRLRRAVM